MPDPVFSAEDRVDNDALPPELVGKTPKEIAQYYQRQNQILADQLERTQRAVPPKKEPVVTEEKFDIFNDAEGSVDRRVKKQVNEALANASSMIAPGVIGGIRVSMSSSHKDWTKFGSEVEKRMAKFSAEGQMNPEFWESTYLLVKGENADKLVEEAVNTARNPIERPTAKGQEPPAPRALDDQEKVIAGKFGMSAEKYRTAADRLDSEGGMLPFTLDSKNPKRNAS